MSWVSSWWHKNTGPTFGCHGASSYDMGQKFWMSWLCPTVLEYPGDFLRATAITYTQWRNDSKKYIPLIHVSYAVTERICHCLSALVAASSNVVRMCQRTVKVTVVVARSLGPPVLTNLPWIINDGGTPPQHFDTKQNIAHDNVSTVKYASNIVKRVRRGRNVRI